MSVVLHLIAATQERAGRRVLEPSERPGATMPERAIALAPGGGERGAFEDLRTNGSLVPAGTGRWWLDAAALAEAERRASDPATAVLAAPAALAAAALAAAALTR